MSAPKEYLSEKKIKKEELYLLFQGIKDGNPKRCLEALETAKRKGLNIINETIDKNEEVVAEERAFMYLTPLQYAAAINSSTEMLDLLFKYGADITKRTAILTEDATVFDICIADPIWTKNRLTSSFFPLIKRLKENCDLLLYFLNYLDKTYNENNYNILYHSTTFDRDGTYYIEKIKNDPRFESHREQLLKVLESIQSRFYGMLTQEVKKKDDREIDKSNIRNAIKRGDVKKLQEFIKEGKDFNFTTYYESMENSNYENMENISLLFYAYLSHEGKRRIEVLETLLKAQVVDINACVAGAPETLQVPLLIIAYEDKDTFTLLKKYNASLKGYLPPIHIAMLDNDQKTFESILTEADLKVLNEDSTFGTPLILATSSSDLSSMEKLISKGVDINVYSKSMLTNPLIEALESKDFRIIGLLLINKADMFFKDADGQTPYSRAANNEFGRESFTILLIYHLLGSLDKKYFLVSKHLASCLFDYEDLITFQSDGDIVILQEFFRSVEGCKEKFTNSGSKQLILTEKNRKDIVQELFQEADKLKKMPEDMELIKIIFKNISEKKKHDKKGNQEELCQLFKGIKTGNRELCIKALEAANKKGLTIVNDYLTKENLKNEERDFNRLTPVLYAVAIHSPIEIVDLLFQHGADINAQAVILRSSPSIFDMCCADPEWINVLPGFYDSLLKKRDVNCDLLQYLLKYLDNNINENLANVFGHYSAMGGCDDGSYFIKKIENDPRFKSHREELLKLLESIRYKMRKIRSADRSSNDTPKTIVIDDAFKIQQAIKNCDIDKLTQYVREGMDFNVNVYLDRFDDYITQVNTEVTPLFYAYSRPASKERLKMLEILVKAKGVDVNACVGYTENLIHPLLIVAARNNDVDVLTLLIQSGADINRTGPQGTTALMSLRTKNNSPKLFMDYLLAAGADPHVINKLGETALTNAIIQYESTKNKDWLACIETLLRKKADPNLPKISNSENAFPITQALLQKSVKLFQLLKSYGAVFDAKLYRDISPLHLSILENDKKTFESILHVDSALLNADSEFGTPLIMAIKSGDIWFVEKLIEKKADLNAYSVKCKTAPLIEGIIEGLENRNVNMVTLLLSARADLFLKDERGRSLYSRAINREFGSNFFKLFVTYNLLGNFDKSNISACQYLMDFFLDHSTFMTYQSNGDIVIFKDLFKDIDGYQDAFKTNSSNRVTLALKHRNAIVRELIQLRNVSGKMPEEEEIIRILWKNTSEKKKYDRELEKRKQEDEMDKKREEEQKLRDEDDAISIRLQMLQHNMNRISKEIEEIKKTKIDLMSKKDELISILNESNELLSTHNFDLGKKNGQEKKRNTNYDKIKDLDNNYKKFSGLYEAALKNAEKLVEKEQRQKINAIYALRYQQRMTKKAIKGPNKTGEDTLKELEGFCNSFDSNKKAFEAMKLKDTINTAIESSKKTLDLLKENIRMQEATEKKKEADKREEEEQRLMASIQERDAAMRQAELNIEREKEREAFLKKLKVLKEIRRKELELAAERKRAREEALAKEKENQEQARLLGESKDAAEIVSQQPNPDSKPSDKTKIRIRDHVSRLGEFLEAIKSYREENDIINEDLRLVFRDALLLVSAQAMETIKEDMLMIPKKIALLFRNNIYHGQALYKNLDLKEVCEMARLLHEYLLNTNIKSGKNASKKGERKEEAETRQTNLASRKMFQKLVEDQGLIKDNTFKMIIASVASREKSFEQCELQIAARDQEFQDRIKLKDRIDKGISEAGILQAAIDFSIARLGTYFRYCHKFYRGQAQYILQNQKWEEMSWYAIIVRHDLQKNAKKEKLLRNFMPGFEAHKAHKAHEAQRRKPSDSERPRKSSSPESRSRGDSTGRERMEVRADRGGRADRGDYKSSIGCP